MSSRSEFMQLDILEAPKQKATARFYVIRTKNVFNKIGNERLEEHKSE